MINNTSLPAYAVVQSLAGRDKDHLYVVVGKLANPYVWIADGRKYKVGKPKKKNCRHLCVLKDSPVPQRMSDEWIRSVLNRAKVELTREVTHV